MDIYVNYDIILEIYKYCLFIKEFEAIDASG
jgi:hypothetical protein